MPVAYEVVVNHSFDAKNVYNKGQWLIAQVHWGKQVHLVQRSDMYMPTTQRAELLMLVAQRETGAQPR